MKVIWKFSVEGPRVTLEMPQDAKILSVQVQENVPHLWALVDEHAPKERRSFQSFMTGEPFNQDGLTHLASCLLNGGGFVVHVFEETP